MKRPIIDKAEISVDFPDKTYIGSFGRHSSYDVAADEHGVHITFARSRGEKRQVGCHIQYHLLADILDAIGQEMVDLEGLDESHCEALQAACARVNLTLGTLLERARTKAGDKPAPRYRVRG